MLTASSIQCEWKGAGRISLWKFEVASEGMRKVLEARRHQKVILQAQYQPTDSKPTCRFKPEASQEHVAGKHLGSRYFIRMCFL